MHLYRTSEGILLQHRKKTFVVDGEWDSLINRSHLHQHLHDLSQHAKEANHEQLRWLSGSVLAPIGTQEVWAAGVTYLRSRDARMEESSDSGGADFYSKVYDAERPEIFFKSLAHRVAGPGQDVNIRTDSVWNVPEPELTLYINSKGEIQAYTIGNDMSSRSIEGENPLYLPQAKCYEQSAALGPCLYVPAQPLSEETTISITIARNVTVLFSQSITLNRMKRKFPELVAYLYRGLNFSSGCFLMTGTGIVPPNDFTLHPGDDVTITIEGIGSLTNSVAVI